MESNFKNVTKSLIKFLALRKTEVVNIIVLIHSLYKKRRD